MEAKDTPFFGIDLGTTYSCISYVDDDRDQPIVVKNIEGDTLTPSVVQFEGKNHIVVGKVAKACAVLYPEDVIELVKRQMGKTGWYFTYQGDKYTAVEISSYILKKVVQDAESILPFPVRDVVITCPAYFGIAQREATAEAGRLAGLNVRAIINEPTAATLTYGAHNEQNQTILVYDLGGGTFDVTVSEIRNNTITVVTINGDNHLGGHDWDKVLVKHFAQQWQITTGSHEIPLASPETVEELYTTVESAKRDLSGRMITKRSLTYKGKRAVISLTREKFDELTNPLLEKTIQITRDTINEARKRGISQIDKILLVGGSTRMRQVEERLQKEFAFPLKIFDPDEAVAKGAAIYARKLQIGQKIEEELKQGYNIYAIAKHTGLSIDEIDQATTQPIREVSSHSFGVIVRHKATQDLPEREGVSNIILVNTPLPARQEKTYFTFSDNQPEVRLQIIETETTNEIVESSEYNEYDKIAHIIMKLPSGLPKHTPITVTFMLNEQNRLDVKAREEESGTSIKKTIVMSVLSPEENAEAEKRRGAIAIE